MRDELFIRGAVPMTKSEVRAVSLSKLELTEDSVLYDIGAGTGSVSIEAASLLKTGSVLAIEKKQEAVELIRLNQDRFRVKNLTVIHGEAPEAFEGLEMPTHAFIGGTSGNLSQILDWLLKRNPHIRITVNTVSLETLAQLSRYLSDRSIDAEIVLIQTSRAVVKGGYHLMQGLNPVYIISFGREETEDGADGS